LFSPYDEFDYDAFFGGLERNNLAFRSDNDDFTAGTDNNDDNELLLVVADYEPAKRFLLPL
jgi:hypothetical protein